MSMSTPGEIRRPSSTQPKATPADGGPGKDPVKAGPAKAGAPKTSAAGSGGSAGSGAKTGAAGSGAKTGAAGSGAKTGAAKTGAAASGAKVGGTKASPQTGGAKSSATKVAAAKAAVKAAGAKGRTFAPIKVAQERNWGPILMFTAAGVVALLIVGFGGYQVWKAANKGNWEGQANGIAGIQNFRKSDPNSLQANHQYGPLTYKQNPPVGGTHNYNWQNCMGDVYEGEIPKEQAVHSLEHGAVWIAYRPDLAKDQVDLLAAKVKDKSFMLMSPYPGLDKPISLQAWGYQLKVDKATDGRIDQFIQALRQNASQEPQAGCSGGITDSGSAIPLDLGKPAATPAASAPAASAPATPAG